MLPEVCVVDDMYRPPVPLPHNMHPPVTVPHINVTGAMDSAPGVVPEAPSQPDDTDETIPKRRSFSDEYLLSCRQSNTVRRLADLDLLPVPPRHVTSVSDVIVVNDERFPVLGQLLRRLDLDCVSRLYVVGCRVRLDAECQLLLARVSLRSLVLSYASLHHLPDCIFDMPSLEVLKVDHNNLVEIPSLLGRLERLTSFNCASQRPRVRLLPGSITRLHQLQVLSISDNSIEAIDWIITLPNLRVLRCDRNRISHLPVQLVNLRQLTWLDVSHNPIQQIPHQLVELISGSSLCRFDWFSISIRPRWMRRQTTDQLCAYLQLEAALASELGGSPAPQRDAVYDVTVAMFGDTGSGKRTLARALADPRGVHRDTATRLPAMVDIIRYSSHVGSAGIISTSGNETTKSPLHRLRSDILRSNGVLADSSNSASGRCNFTAVAYSADYVDAYFRQLKTDIRVLLIDMTALEVGQNGAAHQQTLARHVTRTQLWLDALQELEPDSPVLLVGTHADLVRATSTFSDFVDELFPADARRHHRRLYATTTAPCHDCLLCADNRKLNSSSTLSAHLIKSRSSPGGHFDELSVRQSSPTNHLRSPDTPRPTVRKHRKSRLPHVVGYVIVDSVRNYPKTDSKKANNSSMERLRTVLQRVGLARADRVASSWADFGRHITSLGETCGLAGTPCLTLDDVICIARNYGIDNSQVSQVLLRMHRRCQVVYIPDDSDHLLSSVVCVNCAWFMRTIVTATSEAARSQGAVTDASKLVRSLFADNYADVGVGKLSSAHSLVVLWLFAAFQSLHVCIPFGISQQTGSRLFLFTDHLEVGVPHRDVWLDRPELDERQVTCDVGLWTRGGFRMFCDLLASLCGDAGRRHLDVLLDPAPVLLAHDAVFFTAFDVDGCPDCRPTRRLRTHVYDVTGNDVIDDDADAVQSDDVLHKVRLSLNVTRWDAVRVQVRGPTPCCVLRAIINFIDLHLDDDLDLQIMTFI